MKWKCHLSQPGTGMGTYGIGQTEVEALRNARANYRESFGTRDYIRPEFEQVDDDDDNDDHPQE